MRAFEAFEKIENEPSKKGKEDLLKQYDCDALRTLLHLTYNPFLTYRVNQLEWPEQFAPFQPDVTQELETTLRKLAEHTTRPSVAKGMLRSIMAKCTESGANWVARIVKRDLKIGISDKTINKVFPGLVPVFNVQLAHPMVDKAKGTDRWDEVQYPVVVEEKFDGMRIITVCDGERVQYFSREGHELDLHVFDKQVLSLRPGTAFVLDGEGIGIGDEPCPRCAVAVKAFKAGKPWVFQQGLSMIRSQDKYTDAEMRLHVGLKIWDLLGHDFFLSQGAGSSNLPLSRRKMQLRALFEREDRNTPNIQMVKNYVAQSKQDVIDLFNHFRGLGGEGVVVKDMQAPYEFKRSSAVLKLKQFHTADLRVLDCLPGTPDSKYAGCLGTLLVGDDQGVTGKVMGGFDDDQRVEFWLRHLRGEMVGAIVEVSYMEVTPDNSLRHATFVREREDKNACSWH